MHPTGPEVRVLWEGQRVFVTGGTSGIGLALATELVGRGAHVWICAPEAAAVEETVAGLRAGARVDQRVGGVALDVSDRAAVEVVRDVVLEGLGGLDVVVNNAGIATVAVAEETSPEDYERMMAVNYFGTVWVTRTFLPHLVAQRHGAICCVSSSLGEIGVYGYTAYGASKFAVVGYCACLRQDLLRHGVSVHVALPPDVDTPQLRANLPKKPPETRALAETARLFTAGEVARAILDGVAAGRFRIVIGRANRFILGVNGAAPGLVRRYVDRQLTRWWAAHPMEKA
jgi:3-dehydrosphinganine reductase